MFLALAILATVATSGAFSAASFTTASSTSVQAATLPFTSDSLAVSAGNGQSATVATALATAPSALVSDANGNPVSGVTVTFAVASGGGSVSGASATTTPRASPRSAAGPWAPRPAPTP